jgi:hypothetical protein
VKTTLAALLLLALTGCFRVTDPAYAFRHLKASEPEEAGDSLIFGTMELGGFFNGTVDTVVLRRVAPAGDEFTGATEHTLFRAFRRRPMKDGTFAVTVSPGLYEIVELDSSSWFKPQTIRFSEGARVASRFAVTRPGVYDLGVLRLRPTGAFSNTYGGTRERGDADPQRAGLLREALAGTSWEKYAVKAAR